MPNPLIEQVATVRTDLCNAKDDPSTPISLAKVCERADGVIETLFNDSNALRQAAKGYMVAIESGVGVDDAERRLSAAVAGVLNDERWAREAEDAG